MTDWTLVGGDPAPGDVGLVGEAAGAFDRMALRAGEASEALTRLVGQIDSGEIWAGRAADTWVEQARQAPPDLDKVRTSFGEAANAIRTYAVELDGAQVAARRAADDAISADAALRQARADVARTQAAAGAAEQAAGGARSARDRAASDARSLPPDADPGTRAAADGRARSAESAVWSAEAGAAGAARELDAARAAERSAQERLDDARRRAELVRESAEESARRLESLLNEASHHGIRNRGFLRRTVEDTFQALDDMYSVESITAALDLVSDVMGVAALVAAFIPGGQVVAVALAGASVIFSAAALIGHIVMATRGQESWTDVGWRAAGTALSAFGAVKGFKGIMAAQSQVAKMTQAGKTITAANRPMAMRTTTEQFLGDVKRVRWPDARTATGFMRTQVGVAPGPVSLAAVRVVVRPIEVAIDVNKGGSAMSGLIGARQGEPLVVTPAPTLPELVVKVAAGAL